MKNTFLVLAILFGSFLFAQENNPSVQLEKVTEDIVMIKVFHDNGEIAQSGFVKNNKLEGKWESFTASGDRVSTGNYKEGKKVGQWFFFCEDTVLLTFGRIMNCLNNEFRCLLVVYKHHQILHHSPICLALFVLWIRSYVH